MPRNPPVAKKRGPGRPPHVPTAASRRKVAIGAGGGMRHEDLATALGISRPTLELHYAHELSAGALSKRLEVLEGLHAAAKRGSSSAARAYLEAEAEFGVPPAPKEPAAPPEAKPEKVPALGKKEQAQADALTAHVGTDWADLLPRPATPQ